MFTFLAVAPALVPSWDGLCASRHQEFLTEHWQKRPLLIRGLLTPEEVEALCPLTPEELLDLAGDADVCSRLVLETGGAQQWELRHGPFDQDVLELMGNGSVCSLLVQQVVSFPLANVGGVASQSIPFADDPGVATLTPFFHALAVESSGAVITNISSPNALALTPGAL